MILGSEIQYNVRKKKNKIIKYISFFVQLNEIELLELGI